MNDDGRACHVQLSVAADKLLPHKGKMCCIDALVDCRENGAEAVAVLRRGHALVGAAGRMDSFGFIELAAQTAGAMHGWLAGENRPELAMLVGVQKFAAPGVAVLGDELRIYVSVLGQLEDMLSLGFAIGKDGTGNPPLAEGRLSVFVPRIDDARLHSMARPAIPGVAIPGNRTSVPQNLPDSIALFAVDGPNIVNEDGKRTIAADFSFTLGFPGFDGHFPNNPIVPGIVQLMAAAHTASLGRPMSVASLSRCKFLRPVVPGEKMHVLVDAEEGDTTLRCRARINVEKVPCAEAGFILRTSPC